MENQTEAEHDMNGNTKRSAFVICLSNDGNPASLEVGKVYRVVKPEPTDGRTWIRIIDESGEDYLYPRRHFAPVELPPRARRAVMEAASA
jgi:primosomal protein N'